MRSDPFIVEPPYNAGALADWRPASEEAEPVPLAAATFDGISNKLLAIARQSGVRLRGLPDGLAEMSSFGRARTLGRLLVGAELIPIVASQSEP